MAAIGAAVEALFSFQQARRPGFVDTAEAASAGLLAGARKRVPPRARGADATTGEPRFCTCAARHDAAAAYVACDRCDHWYHVACVRGLSLFAAKYAVLSFCCASCCAEEPSAATHVRAEVDPVWADARAALRMLPALSAEAEAAWAGAGGAGAPLVLPGVRTRVVAPAPEALAAVVLPAGVLRAAPPSLPGPCGVRFRLRPARDPIQLFQEPAAPQQAPAEGLPYVVVSPLVLCEGGGGGGGEGGAGAGAGAASGGSRPRLTLSLGQKAQWWLHALGKGFVGGARARATWEGLQEARQEERSAEKKKMRR
jgi:hypothetical protein